MGFDEFMDTLDNGVTKRFDQMMAEQDHEAGRGESGRRPVAIRRNEI